ncbi:uncharacterized protein LOC128669888 [Plodia interpunctella]|uniref:uncharacterized protein LOC128669888 n=1 Tax=Plodia interpunctella TaxID=58824 RepID=UPI002368E9AB|nr:uncharacterized protein LOC128669888 [Plodia interpunctella]
MALTKFKMESGVQLLARLFKKTDNVKNFYTPLFQTGLKFGEIIEMYSQISLTPLITDIICEALLPSNLGGPHLNILLICTDGNMDFNMLLSCLRKKLLDKIPLCTDIDIDKLIQDVLNNLAIYKVYDATQFYTTIHKIESIMIEYPDTSLIIFHTLTAFYWSEQGFKITKMDFYIKNLLKLIRKITKDYKITLFYTRPEYFSSSKDTIENLETSSEHSAVDKVNCRIQLLHVDDCKNYQVNVNNFDSHYTKYFNITDNHSLNWIS